MMHEYTLFTRDNGMWVYYSLGGQGIQHFLGGYAIHYIMYGDTVFTLTRGNSEDGAFPSCELQVAFGNIVTLRTLK